MLIDRQKAIEIADLVDGQPYAFKISDNIGFGWAVDATDISDLTIALSYGYYKEYYLHKSAQAEAVGVYKAAVSYGLLSNMEFNAYEYHLLTLKSDDTYEQIYIPVGGWQASPAYKLGDKPEKKGRQNDRRKGPWNDRETK